LPLPTAFSTRLAKLTVDTPIGTALSGFGFDGSNNGLDLIAIGAGTLVPSLVFKLGGDGEGVNSGLATLSGEKVYLYTDPSDAHIVVGRANSAVGSVVVAFYLDESKDIGGNVIGAKVWSVQYQALRHADPANADDPLTLAANVLKVGGAALVEPFSLQGAPSGQNLFLTIGAPGASGVAIVATGKKPANQSVTGTIVGGDTVNTSQAAGSTTIGVNNQMIDPIIKKGGVTTLNEGLYFTYVTGANPNYTVGTSAASLTQTEADVEANIQFSGLFAARTASFVVAQLQGGDSAVIKLTASEVDGAGSVAGINYIGNAGLNGTKSIPIASVSVLDASGNPVILGVNVNIAGGVAVISGVKAGYRIRYTTDATGTPGIETHNRLLIENAGSGSGKNSASFDVGSIELETVSLLTPVDISDKLRFEDDGPKTNVVTIADDIQLITSDAAAVSAAGNYTGGYVATASGSYEVVFEDAVTAFYGADGAGSKDAGSFELVLGIANGGDSGLSSNGAKVYLYEVGSGSSRVIYGSTTATGWVGSSPSNVVFKVEVIDADTGEVKLTQSAEVDHGIAQSTDFPSDARSLADNYIVLKATVTTKDGESAADSVTNELTLNIGGNLEFRDDGPNSLNPAAAVLTNVADQSATANLDDDANLDNNVGADQPGTIAFTGIANGQLAQGVIDGGLKTLTSGGRTIYLYLVDIDGSGSAPLQLQGWTQDDSGNKSGLIYTVTLAPDGSLATSADLYRVELLAPIGVSSQTTITDFGSVKSGNSPFASLDILGTPQDLLFSAVSNGGTTSTVNVSTTGLAVSNQSINDGEILRIDFVNNVDTGKTGSNSWYNYGSSGGGHFDINDFQFSINQVNTPGGGGDSDGEIEVWVRIFKADDDDPASAGAGTTEAHASALADDMQLSTITKITVFKYDTATVPNLIEIRPYAADGDGNFDGLVSDGSGGWLVPGLDLNDRVMVTASGTGYNRIEIANSTETSLTTAYNLTGEAFDIGRLGYVTNSAQVPRVDLSYNVVLTDADGDQTALSTLNITLNAPSSVTPTATPQLAGLLSSPMPAPDPITGETMLDVSALVSVKAATIDFGNDQGAGSLAVERLGGTDVLTGQLKGSKLGLKDGGSITRDDDDATFGWSGPQQFVATGQMDFYTTPVDDYGSLHGYEHDVFAESSALRNPQLSLITANSLPLG